MNRFPKIKQRVFYVGHAPGSSEWGLLRFEEEEYAKEHVNKLNKQHPQMPILYIKGNTESLTPDKVLIIRNKSVYSYAVELDEWLEK